MFCCFRFLFAQGGTPIGWEPPASSRVNAWPRPAMPPCGWPNALSGEDTSSAFFRVKLIKLPCHNNTNSFPVVNPSVHLGHDATWLATSLT
jgi:hypothetical protein